MAEEIEAFVSSLLNLVGIQADPLSSREHILLSTIIQHAWQQGRSLDLAALVASVQQPPMRKVGVLDLDTYYPADARTALALKLNGLLASPERKLASAERRLDSAQDALARAEATRTSTMASDLIGGLFGGRRSVRSSMRRASTAQARVGAAADKVEDLHAPMAELQADLDSEVAGIRDEWEARASEVGTLTAPLEKSDVRVDSIGLVWIPTGT